MSSEQCEFGDTAYLLNSGWCSPNVTLFMTLIDLMIRANYRVADPCRRAPYPQVSSPTEVDFIVVGAGVAGAVVGGRLSESGAWDVLVLEAGPDEPSSTGVPALAVSALGTSLDWGFKTEPQNTACLNKGGSCRWSRGKMVGGTGSMSGMMYTRGHRAIFDEWSKNGNAGWTYKECLEFFKKSENNKMPIEGIDSAYHGRNGPLTVQQFPHHPAFAEDLVKAGVELGYRYGDVNGHNQSGFAIAQVMFDDGARMSTARAFLRPGHNRPNLKIRVNSRVTKVLIDELSKRALGVEFVDNEGKTQRIMARKEVILSAGAIGSPHILLLSGVGPAQDLQKHGIPAILNLKVGHNLHNHVSVGIKFTIDDPNKRTLTKDILQEYLKNGTGPVASTGLTQVTAFMHSKYANHVPDLQIFFDGFSAGCSLTGDKDECENGKMSPDCGKRYLNFRPTNVMTKSKGYLTLRSKDPFDSPLMYPNYLTDKRDVEVLTDGIRQGIRISQTNALKKYNMTLITVPAPLCKQHEFGTDSYWECVIRTYTGPEHHQAGTCKMGPPSDPSAVVDPELRVHGITNLRVIDASIFPYVPNSNPIAAIIMVAEKGAHMISSAWKGI